MKSQNRLSDRWKRLAIFMLFAFWVTVGLATGFDYYYDLNDDTTIKDILSGTYTGTPSGYSIQMLYPLGSFIALLYRAIPGISWYGLFLCLCQFMVMFLVLIRVQRFAENIKGQVLTLTVSLLLILGLLLRWFVIIQYSVTSGMCMAGAIFLFLTGENKGTVKDFLKSNVIPVILVLFAFMIRTEVCIMLLPFLLLAGLVVWSDEQAVFSKINVKKYLMLIGSTLIGLALLYGTDKLSFSLNTEKIQWQSFNDFFEARTKLYDFYGIPDYEMNKNFYDSIGMTKESYTLLQNYNFSLDADIDEQMLEKIVQYQQQQAKEGKNGMYVLPGPVTLITKNTPKEAIWLYKQHLLAGNDGIFGITILCAYVIWFLICSGRKKSGFWWKAPFLMVIRSILWIYLFMVDRSLDRVTIPLLLSELAFIIGLITREENIQNKLRQRKKMQSSYYLFEGVLIICAAAACLINVKAVSLEINARKAVNIRWETLISYCNNQYQKNITDSTKKFYVIDVYSSTSYVGVPYSERIFPNGVYTDNSYRNFDICGGWLAKSPLSAEKLKQAGVEDIESALYQQKAYFIAACDKDLSWIMQYYAKKDMPVSIEQIDSITVEDEEAFGIYQLRPINIGKEG